MRVLVTGGAGFIGSHVAELLLAGGHEVAVVDDLSRGRRKNVPGGAAFYDLDVRLGCREVFEEFGPEAVCHQAAQADVRRSVAEPVLDLEINTGGTLRLLENCVRHHVGSFVFASTGGAIYGEQREFPASEDHPEYPISPYGISKLAAEHYLRYYEAHYGLPYVALRQRLRAAAGPARRGGRRGDLRQPPGVRRDVHHQWHRRTDPRLRLRRGRGQGERAGAPGWSVRGLQRRDSHRDQRQRALRDDGPSLRARVPREVRAGEARRAATQRR